MRRKGKRKWKRGGGGGTIDCGVCEEAERPSVNCMVSKKMLSYY